MSEKTNKNSIKQPEKAHEALKKVVEEVTNKKEDEAKELIDQLQRLQAEFENYKKRTEKEKQEILQLGKATVIVKVLDIVDNFELAIEALKTEKEEIKHGLVLILKQLHKFLEEEGIKAINAEGKKFDPFMHEAMKVENSEKDNIVLKELQKGYTLHNKVVRTSKVTLGKKQEA